MAAHAERRPGWRGRALRRDLTGWGFAAPAIVGIMLFSFVPAIWAFVLSLQENDLISPGTYVGADNYRAIVDDPALRDAVKRTLVFAVLYVPACAVLGLGLAMLLNLRIRFIGFYRTCVFIPFVASAAAIGILFGYVFDSQFGIANRALEAVGISPQLFLESPDQAMYVVVIVALWATLGFTVVVYLAALQDIKPELLEAASIDGAGAWARFRHVIWPSLGPITAFTAIWNTITALQLFDIVYTTTRGGPLDATTTMVYYAWSLAFRQFEGGYGSTVAVVLFVVIFVITVAMVGYSRRRGLDAF